MKKIISFSIACFSALFLLAQTYPDPEFSNEVYYLKKEIPYSLVRLEKNSAKQINKANMITGAEFSYSIEGKTSPVRIGRGDLSFIFSDGSSSGSSKPDPAIKKNVMDLNAFGEFNDNPLKSIILYKTDIDGATRKIYIQKSVGHLGFHKNQTSDKYTFSLKKIRDGYWELVIDKPLPKGEYAFSMKGISMEDANFSPTVFAFGVD